MAKANKKNWVKNIWILAAFIIVVVYSTSVFGETPAFTFGMDTNTFDVTDDEIVQGTLILKNMDPDRLIILNITGEVEGKDGWFHFEEDYILISPMESRELEYILYVPEDVCETTYNGLMIAKLLYYGADEDDNPPVSLFSAIGDDVTIDVTSGITCTGDPIPGLDTPISESDRDYIYSLLGKDPNEEAPDIIPFGIRLYLGYLERVVYHDMMGDGAFDMEVYDKIIDMGMVRIYDYSDTMLYATNLDYTEGIYNVPSGTYTGTQDFYITVDTSKFDTGDPTILDKNWEGNLYVNRMGDSLDIGTAFEVENKDSYEEIIENIDMRSRNTDQEGTWSAGTISIGPDDLDQIISPSRWDELVATSDFKYADLDYDGRIDPDDKDHIISPLYWDFPN